MKETDKNMLAYRIIELDNPDLPITCPNNQTPVTFMHPRVWLTPSANGTCRCPYCSTLYIIRSFIV
ncbi:zinc-finger domain-containing protein [Oxalobacter sp. OttesenSCG-928-P03]|nr:zinc-finger domain-containing protein [Oxalobacter sp. OttesenSCG-928-P03]